MIFFWVLFLGLILAAYLCKPNLFVLYFVSWGLLIVNALLGPLSYPQAVVSIEAVFLLAVLITSYAVGYALTSVTVYCRNCIDLARNNEILINKIGAFFALAWVAGGLIYATPFLWPLDLYSLRLSYVYGEKSVSFFSQIGSVLSGLSWLIIARIAFSRSVYSPRVAQVTLISLVLIPVFMAGRQIYMQLIVMLLVGLVISSRFRIERPSKLVDVSGQIKLIFIIAVILISAVTTLRFSGESLVYATKVDQFSAISNSVVDQNYMNFLVILPVWLGDLLVEFNYYFSSQIVKFLERMSASDASLFDIRIFEKVPFIKANLEKICGVIGYVCFEPKYSTFIGSVSESSWGTVYSTNLSLFGVGGTVVINFIFGVTCAIAQKAFNKSPHNFIAFNFLLANSVVVFYSIMDSIFNEIYFVVYYTLSMIMFFSSLRIKVNLKKTKQLSVSYSVAPMPNHVRLSDGNR